jgi:hypothetical protein
MSHELFTDVSVEQQEVVAGGGIDAYEDLYTTFSKEALAFKSVIASGEGGSAITQEVVALDVFTDASKYFEIDI